MKGLRGGRVGQEALRCPGRPQYKHRLWRILLSLSSTLRWVKPTCIDSGSGSDVIPAEAERKRGCRRERTRLSMWIARSWIGPEIYPRRGRPVPTEAPHWDLYGRGVWDDHLTIRSAQRVCGRIVHSLLLYFFLDGGLVTARPPPYPQRVFENLPEALQKTGKWRENSAFLTPHSSGPFQCSSGEKEQTKAIRLSSVEYSVGCWLTNIEHCSKKTLTPCGWSIKLFGKRQARAGGNRSWRWWIWHGRIHRGWRKLESLQGLHQLPRERGKSTKLLLMWSQSRCLSRYLRSEMIENCWIDFWRSLL